MSLDLEVGIDPIDPLLFGDNRSARAGEDHALSDQEPSPITFYGAVGGRIAAALGARGEEGWAPAGEVLGEFVAAIEAAGPDRAELMGYCLRGRGGELWLPRPLTLRVAQVAEQRFALPGLQPADEAASGLASIPYERPLTAADQEEESEEPLLVSEDLLAQLLTGAYPEASDPLDGSVIAAEELYRSEVRAGLAIDNDTGAAVSGRLFTRPYRRFRSGVDPAGGGFTTAGFRAWYRVLALAGRQPADFSGVGFLGGDRGRARFTFEALEDDPLADLRRRVLAAVPQAKQGFLLYLLTPAIVRQEGLTLQGHRPVAAALGPPSQVSGWSAAARQQQPRPLRTLAPAGSVLFFRWEEQETAEERRRRLEQLWLQPLDQSFRHAGFGRVLPGVWG